MVEAPDSLRRDEISIGSLSRPASKEVNDFFRNRESAAAAGIEKMRETYAEIVQRVSE